MIELFLQVKVEKYCQNNKIAYELIACGHYPFSYFTDFKDIINIREENKNEFDKHYSTYEKIL